VVGPFKPFNITDIPPNPSLFNLITYIPQILLDHTLSKVGDLKKILLKIFIE